MTRNEQLTHTRTRSGIFVTLISVPRRFSCFTNKLMPLRGSGVQLTAVHHDISSISLLFPRRFTILQVPGFQPFERTAAVAPCRLTIQRPSKKNSLLTVIPPLWKKNVSQISSSVFTPRSVKLSCGFHVQRTMINVVRGTPLPSPFHVDSTHSATHRDIGVISQTVMEEGGCMLVWPTNKTRSLLISYVLPTCHSPNLHFARFLTTRTLHAQ
jgi:hypothetical protein